MDAAVSQQAVQDILKYRPDFLDGISKFNSVIMPGDGMLGEGDVGLRYYFECGKAALDLIDRATTSTGRKRADIHRVLDFACGFGRVSRWILGAFPHADVAAYDVDKRAVEAIRSNLGLDAKQISYSWDNVAEQTFDLIWVGSLFTLLDQARAVELAALLKSRLSQGGVLAATTHGEYVVGRIRSGEKTYGTEDNGARLLREFDEGGYGFSPYKMMPDYGISVATETKTREVMAHAGLRVLVYLPKGWVKHQDFVACMKD